MSEPCLAVFTYTEKKLATKPVLQIVCSTCGTEIGSHVLVTEAEAKHWNDRVIGVKEAKANMQEFMDCHRTGISYDEYMGFNDDGDEMTKEEYAAVEAAMRRILSND